MWTNGESVGNFVEGAGYSERVSMRALLAWFFFTAALVLVPSASSQSSLPQCNGSPYKNVQPPCFGSHVFAPGFKYLGEWRDGKIYGSGTLTFPDGSKMVGEFKDGLLDGWGESIAADGSKINSGVWQGGVFQNSAPRPGSKEDLRFRAENDRVSRREKAAAKDPFFYAKEQCRGLGFKDKTEKFGTCVLELSKRGDDQQPRPATTTARGDGTPDDATCVAYGYSVGSNGYADCRMKLDQARRDYERELRAYQAEKAAYDQRVAEGQAEARRRQQEKQAQYGFCVAACSSQPGSTALGCMSRCGAAAAGLPFDPGAPPARPSGRTTYVINGQIINCNASPSGSIVTCN